MNAFNERNEQTILSVINPTYIKKRGSIAKAKNIIKKCFERFFFMREKLYFLTNSNVINIDKKVDDVLLYMNEFLKEDEIYFEYKVSASSAEEMKKKPKKVKILILEIKRLISLLRFNQVSEINYKIDFFLEKTLVQKQKFIGGDKIHIIFNEFSPNLIKISEISKEEKRKIVDDYYKHFPDFDLFLDFVSAARFATNRKATYLYLRTRSNWGKSFLMGVFNELGLGYEIRYSDINEGKPVGVNPLEVLNSIVLFLDEFKYFSKEMKKITTEMTIEPKFGFKSKVPVYAKVLMSAEESASFKDGVDEQILNRVIKLDYSDTSKFKQLDKREMYKKYGGETYFNVIVEYVRYCIMTRIKAYIKLGREKAALKAENVLIDLASKFKLEATNLDVELLQVFINFFNRFQTGEDVEAKYKNIADDIIFENNKYYILNMTKTLEQILKIENDADFFAKAKYKIPLIKEILGNNYGNKRIKKFNNKQFKCLTINVKELNFKLLTITKKFEIDDITIEFNNFEDLAIKINERIKDLLEVNNTILIKNLKEQLINFNLNKYFVFVENEKNQIVGVEFKTVSPAASNSEEIPF